MWEITKQTSTVDMAYKSTQMESKKSPRKYNRLYMLHGLVSLPDRPRLLFEKLSVHFH